MAALGLVAGCGGTQHSPSHPHQAASHLLAALREVGAESRATPSLTPLVGTRSEILVETLGAPKVCRHWAIQTPDSEPFGGLPCSSPDDWVYEIVPEQENKPGRFIILQLDDAGCVVQAEWR